MDEERFGQTVRWSHRQMDTDQACSQKVRNAKTGTAESLNAHARHEYEYEYEYE